MAEDALVQRVAVVLGHPVTTLLDDADWPLVAISTAGVPPRLRAAWLARDDLRVVARVGCPPLVPSRMRPVVACAVDIDEAELSDRIVLALATPGVTAVRLLLAADGEAVEMDVGDDAIAAVRLSMGTVVLAADALDRSGEPVGRLVRAGIGELTHRTGSVGGRLGATHGMAAGFGAGEWVADLAAATFAAGYELRLPTWTPEGFVLGAPHVEPDIAYPAAPPAIVMAWSGADFQRVLVRQAPAPLMSPDLLGAGAREVDINGVTGILRGRHLASVVFEAGGRAFGVQVQRMTDGEAVALRVARSIRA